LGFEFGEFAGSLAGGAAIALGAPLEVGEDFGAISDGLAEGEIVVGAVAFLVVVLPELGFGDAEAARNPIAIDEVVHKGAGFGGGRKVEAVVFVDELLEFGEAFGGEEDGFGVNAGSEGVHGGGGLACDGDGAGGFLCVAAIGGNLCGGCHDYDLARRGAADLGVSG